MLEETKVEVFFTISNTTITPTEEAKLSAFANWMKSHPTATATITGYADKGTGNAEINMRLSKQRAESVMKMLTDKYGIAASRLSSDYKGDLVQPFKENDANRVVIGIAKEK
ncbi:MAG: OmpA family protein [Bacteroidales bacterium]|nr:OmpA family protein [Bacteroidales bacterium]